MTTKEPKSILSVIEKRLLGFSGTMSPNIKLPFLSMLISLLSFLSTLLLLRIINTIPSSNNTTNSKNRETNKYIPRALTVFPDGLFENKSISMLIRARSTVTIRDTLPGIDSKGIIKLTCVVRTQAMLGKKY